MVMWQPPSLWARSVDRGAGAACHLCLSYSPRLTGLSRNTGKKVTHAPDHQKMWAVWVILDILPMENWSSFSSLQTADACFCLLRVNLGVTPQWLGPEEKMFHRVCLKVPSTNCSKISSPCRWPCRDDRSQGGSSSHSKCDQINSFFICDTLSSRSY